MSAATPVVQKFFEQYARSRSAMDIDGMAAQYADSFLFAGAAGARVVPKSAVIAGFPKALELFKAAGHTSTVLASSAETAIDEHYAMVRVQLVWRFEKAVAPLIDVAVDTTFILHLTGDVPRIVFQHEHEDLWEALRRHGGMPAQG